MSAKKSSRIRKKEMEGVFVISLGCPKNFVDTELIAGSLISAGIPLTFDQNTAAMTLINTCAFLPEAREEALINIEEALEWKAERKGRKVAVCGCLIQWDREGEVKSRYPEVDYWCGIDEVPQAAKLLTAPTTETTLYHRQETPVYLYDEQSPRLQLTLPHFAYLKIADGCNNRCAYCSIPRIRGSLRSRSIDSVLKEADNLLSNGVKELVLIAQDTTAYGHDRQDNTTLSRLLAELDKFPGKFWVRLLYTHPAHYTDELIEQLAKSKHVVPYLDIPLQHISDRLLKAMGRRTTGNEIRELIRKLRTSIPNLQLRTTFITGLPGETETEFEELKAFILETKFDRLGVFAYSPEPETPAATMPDQVEQEIAEARAEELMRLQAEISANRNESLQGKELEVILDSVDGRNAVGRSFADAPEIDNVVFVHSSRELRSGGFYRVRIQGGDEYDLEAVLK